MEPVVVVVVLVAAVMHAAWNTFVKIGEDRVLTMSMVLAVGGLLGGLLIFPNAPPAPESWKFIALSAAIHTAYFCLLVVSYRVGDLSHAYPLARGSAPLMVAVGAALFADELLSPGEIAGIAVISAGILSLLMSRRYGLGAGWRSIVYPLATGATIAGYTVTDGLGVRASGSPGGYIGWLFVIEPLPFLAVVALGWLFVIEPLPFLAVVALTRRRDFGSYIERYWKPGVAGGALSFGAYALVIWALGLGAMAQVAALRETSVVIAAVIGTRLLGESFGYRRVVSAMIVAAGVVLLRVAG